MGPEDRLGLGRPGSLGLGAFLGHPAVELTPPDRPTPELGRDIDRPLVTHLRHQPETALADAEGVPDPGLEAQGGVEGDHLDAAAGAAEAPPAQLDLAREGDQPARGPAVRDQAAAAARASDRAWHGGFKPLDERGPEHRPDLCQGRADRALE
jgi:hypothetical protein